VRSVKISSQNLSSYDNEPSNHAIEKNISTISSNEGVQLGRPYLILGKVLIFFHIKIDKETF